MKIILFSLFVFFTIDCAFGCRNSQFCAQKDQIAEARTPLPPGVTLLHKPFCCGDNGNWQCYPKEGGLENLNCLKNDEIAFCLPTQKFCNIDGDIDICVDTNMIDLLKKFSWYYKVGIYIVVSLDLLGSSYCCSNIL